MINFFRKIRKKLADDNKPLKYLLYALGEIMLVVLGILIAIQVDNWNEERKLQGKQYDILMDLRSDMVANLKELERGLALNKLTLKQYRIIMDAILKDEPYSSKIDSACRYLPNWHSPFFISTTYESIKNKEDNLIENEQLKKQISNLYEQEFAFLKEDYDKVEWSFNNSIKIEILNRYLWFKDEGAVTLSMVKPRVYPVNFQKMKSDPEFIHLVSLLILTRKGGINQYEMVIQSINDVIHEIDAEFAGRYK